MESGEELITININTSLFNSLVKSSILQKGEYEIHKIETKDEEYPEDESWLKLKKDSTEAYKKLKEYEFKKRHP